jgi:hypothetical protein
MARRSSIVVALAAVLAAGCGGTTTRSAGPSTAPPATVTAPTTTTPAETPAQRRRRCDRQARTLTRLHRDLASVKRASNVPVRDRLKGGPAVNEATDRFLLDVAQADVDLKVKNRLIDHAAASVFSACEQCFQALEASRPIPSIAHGGPGAGC